MDALGGYDVHRGVIPAQYRRHFYQAVAACHVSSRPFYPLIRFSEAHIH
jgi:hypothetical protein